MKIKATVDFLIFAIACLFAITTHASNNDNTFNSTQKEQIQQIVHDYLLNNPELLIEVQQKLQAKLQKQSEEFEKQAQQDIQKFSKEIFNSSSPISGDPKGKITLVEFFDYQCPHCKQMAPIVSNISKNNPNLRIVYKELPIYGGASLYAAKAALAAAKQGKYSEFHDALMNTNTRFTNEKVLEIAKQAGLNIDKLQKDIASDAIDAEINDTRKLAAQLKIMATPAFILGKTQNADGKSSLLIPSGMNEDALQNYIDMVSQQANG